METNRTSSKPLAAEAKRVIAAMDRVLDSLDATRNSGALRRRCDRALWRTRLGVIRGRAVAGAEIRRACAEADLYVHRHPWRTVGIAAVTGLALGTLAGILGGRRNE